MSSSRNLYDYRTPVCKRRLASGCRKYRFRRWRSKLWSLAFHIVHNAHLKSKFTVNIFNFCEQLIFAIFARQIFLQKKKIAAEIDHFHYS